MRQTATGSAGRKDAALPARMTRPARRAAGWLGLALLALATGCGPSIRWRTYVYDVGLDEARREGKPMFVYLRNWYLPECTRFEDNVLKNAAVVSATGDLYAVFLEADWSTHLMQAWTLQRTPAVAVLTAGGELVSASDDLQTTADLLDFLVVAREGLGRRGGPAPAP